MTFEEQQLFEAMQYEIGCLQKHVDELESQLHKNSSKPLSSEGLSRPKRKNKNLRTPVGVGRIQSVLNSCQSRLENSMDWIKSQLKKQSPVALSRDCYTRK